MYSTFSIKREIFLAVGVSALVFSSALAIGKPFIKSGGGAPPAASSQMLPSPSPASNFNGGIGPEGQNLLRHSAHHGMRFGNPTRSRTYEGKTA